MGSIREDHGKKLWRRIVGYGKKEMAETAFSTFKCLYGEYCIAKKMGTIPKEPRTKNNIYNRLINL